MPDRDEVTVGERARIVSAVDAPDSTEDRDACNAAGPFRGARCTEPEGHTGDHQHHADGARAVWSREG